MGPVHADRRVNPAQAVSSEPPAPKIAEPRSQVVQRKSGESPLPDHLRSGVEELSGLSMDGVRVHYDSPKPTQVQALAFTKGQDIELASGQEHHIAHEAWHVVQQMQGRVPETQRLGGFSINSDERLEHDADVMGSRLAARGAVSGSDVRPTRIARSDAGMGSRDPDHIDSRAAAGASADRSDLAGRPTRITRSDAAMNVRGLDPLAGPTAASPTRIARSTAPMVVQRVRGLLPKQKVKVKIAAEEGSRDGAFDEYSAVIDSVSDDGSTYAITYEEQEYNSALYAQFFPRRVDEKNVTAGIGIKIVSMAVNAVKSEAPWENPALGLDADALAKVTRIADKAGRISWLSEEQLEKMIAFLELRKDPPSDALEAFIVELTDDLESIRKTNEPKEKVIERAKSIDASIKVAEGAAFEAQFGIDVDAATWDGMHAAVLEWYAEVKAAERTADNPMIDPFFVAFTANRMTGRQINTKQTGYTERWNVDRHDSEATGKPREMYLDKTVEGIGKRLDPASFTTREKKNEKGVHELSASLLSASKGDIFKQLKPYAEAVVLFMPLPAEKDLQILSALARIKGIPKHWAEVFEDLITHPKFAQSSDMGATFTDTDSGDGARGTFDYGVTGTVIREKGDRARKINAADLADRRREALFYTEVAKSTITKVNEIVMAYRQHASKRFPMYAKWVATGDKKGEGHFIEVLADLSPTGMKITNAGNYVEA